MQQGFPPTEAHKWSQSLGRLGLGSVRIRSMRDGEQPQVTNRGSENHPRYHVLGVLTTRNELRLPGGSYGLGDLTRLKADLAKLGQSPADREQAKIIAFGLTASELKAVREALQAPVDFETQGKPAADTLRRIAAGAKLAVHFDDEATRLLAHAEPVYDDVRGISTGAALAAVLRPYGLTLQPRKRSSERIDLWIAPARSGADAWPVGWPPPEKDTKLLPVLLEFLNAEIDEFTLTETLAAIGPRLKAPMLLDHNALAHNQIDPDKIKISIPPGRTFYKRLLSKILFQARLTSELRVDEAGKPLLWITTLKKSNGQGISNKDHE